MSKLTTKRVASVAAASALILGGVALPSGTAYADWTYAPLPQSQMSIVDVSSVETTGEGANGAAALVLDGSNDTYWHTKWQGGNDPFPHHLTVDLGGSAPALVGQVRLGPRLSSNGSGRIHEYAIHAATGDCTAASFTKVAEGEFPGDLSSRTTERVITLAEPLEADCIKVEYISAWGGASGSNPDSPAGSAASLAELNIDVATEGEPGEPVDPTEPQPIVIPDVDDAVVISDGDLAVTLHPAFPQVIKYDLDGQVMAGNIGDALTSILVNEAPQAVTVAPPVVTADTATYTISVPGLPGVSFDAVASVDTDVFRLELTNLVNPGNVLKRVRFDNHDLVTVGSADANAQLTAGRMGVDRNRNDDFFQNIAATAPGNVQGSFMVFANTSTLAAGFDTNAVEDNRGPGSTSGRVAGDNNRYQRQITQLDDGVTKHGSVWAGTWTWRGVPIDEYAPENGIGNEDNPFVEVKLTADRNADGIVDWQDAGIAVRDILAVPTGAEKVKNEVISRIPFNIVSQATHPFLRTLDDTKRISLATDNLGQKALLKGYQSEGHDAAHPDYAGNYNVRAGGLEDLNVLADESVDFNTSYGVHVNVTESYSEAMNFSEELLHMPPQKAWGWMNQSYYINSQKDLATGKVLERFQDFWDERPDNLDWLYLDVYYPDGWEAQRLGQELAEQGWVIGSEWSDKLELVSVWSHWSQDENYGGSNNKGINSDVIRFVLNSQRDTWNPDPLLGNANVIDFEGWAGRNNYNAFIKNVWERNLPVKFLQQSDIVKWVDGEIQFENGSVVTSDVTSINGTTIPTDRTITYDGATVFSDGAYLLPWSNGGEDRLYHYNIGGGTTTWELTEAWAGQESLTLFELTDTGRKSIGEVTPTDGQITLEADNGTAYVLYPTSEVPAPVEPNWGQGSNISDPGFFSGTLDSYDTTGDVSIVKNDRGNDQARLGAGESVISQDLALDAGSYSAWAWVEIQPGQTRPVTVEVTGDVTPAAYADGADGAVTNTITASTVRNSTASDQLKGLNFQRVRVTFDTDGGDVTFTVRAADGTARVLVDDLRIVDFVAPVDADDTAETVFFEDYENIDTGYFPFVTGATNLGGDARTQLALRHEPFSQKGWWGVDLENRVVDGGKLNDNALDGDWSLMLNNENTGEVLKTSPGAIGFRSGHEYRVSFDYQTTFADQFRIRLGSDAPTGSSVTITNHVEDVLGQQRDTTTWSETFVAAGCGQHFIAIDKLAGANTQHNMTLDNLRVEDLGRTADAEPCVTGAVAVDGGTILQGGETRTVTTTITSLEGEAVTGISHELEVPQGWTATLVTAGAESLDGLGASVATWSVKASREAVPATVTLKGLVTVNGAQLELGAAVDLTVIAGNDVYLSDMQERHDAATSTNGWGPAEWDLSNGEQAAGDGSPLRMRGVEYPKGIGVHAHSSQVFDLAGLECTAFQAIVGIDDVQATRGSVAFSVYGDGELLAGPTAELVGNGPTHTFFVDVTGVETLRLFADGGAAIGNDHGDWALARVSCGDLPPVDETAPVVSDIADAQVVEGAAVSIQVEASDESEPLAYTATGLPAGVSINAETGLVSGTPTAVGEFDVTVTVTDPEGNSADVSFVLVVTATTTEPEPTEPTAKPTEPTTKPTPGIGVPSIYVTPGHHEYNGRKWFTACEPYSVTFRCTTDIWGTTVKAEGDKFVQVNGWQFNNLTYLPAPRGVWANNPLAFTNHWTAADGREWYTECDNAQTGRGACRSYIRADLIKASPKSGGGYTYAPARDWVFNNMVLFSN